MEQYTNLRAGEKGAYLSIIAYIFLSALKLAAGYLGDSEALKADGLNNTTDIIASVAVLIGLRISQRPPDDDHRYGHFRAETIASLVASFIMIYVGIEVLISAGEKIANPIDQNPSYLTIIVAVFSAAVMFAVYKYNLNLSKRINSSAVKAAAYDNRSDAFVSIGTAIGISAALLGFPIVDTITAFIIGLIIIKTAIEIFKEAVFSLTDGFDTELISSIEERVSKIPRVRDVTDVRGRQHGSLILVDITVSVNPNLNVRDSHAITEQIENEVKQLNPYATTLVHIEPYDPKELIICEDDFHF
ncbi:cation diffusion facilitator family transporter [Solibacillus kalamii]|uniref:Ferrous-iron efflux pump FieF n=2 Tax=Solibacillus TaxID=648800 RepID=K1KQP7_9BACL|nr:MULTISPECIES: cation diffusion facilitator family transporter [Solibacillus]AMO85229.1 transporter [Solibacillus silvestris]EKB44806.1 Ferrous-iron efflux pump FieF [Solibacillus isronensis B3W22]MBM7665813.1 cation diffusion facilitator family transporter [Solibacillus kalamii]OBW55808.1 transporter [Solibacillus silvestris]OUZ38744.1 cation transporter [Solibacillus kalamii]